MKKLILVLIVMAAASVTMAGPTLLFIEAFENDNLDQWIGKPNQDHHGQIVADPTGIDNNVLNFTETNTAGDIFTSNRISNANAPITISFDYYGEVKGNGFLGIELDNGDRIWLAGDSTSWSPPEDKPRLLELANNGSWGNYEIEVSPAYDFSIMIEDLGYDGNFTASDAYFDNIRVTAVVPVPGAFLLGGIGVGIVGWVKRRRCL